MGVPDRGVQCGLGPEQVAVAAGLIAIRITLERTSVPRFLITDQKPCFPNRIALGLCPLAIS